MGQVKGNAYEPTKCRVCGKALLHKRTGRPRRHCSNACKQKDYRKTKTWVSASIDAALAGEPEPEQDWRHEGSV